MRDFKVGDEVVSLKNVSGCRVVGDKFIVQRGSMELGGQIWYIDNGGELVHGDSTEFSLVGETESDPINHPDHYQSESGIECIDAIRAALTPEEFRGYCKGAALKYIWRERKKGGNESLGKGVWYLNEAQK